MSEIKYYVGNIEPAQNTIFVFGSNPEGIHGAGAAQVAVKLFGAKMGQGEGLQGRAYALPTKDLRVKENHGLRSIKPESIIYSIKRLYECARQYPDLDFKIAYRNTEEVTLNGYSGYEMMDMFIAAGVIPKNIWISEEWFKTGRFSTLELRLKEIDNAIKARFARFDILFFKTTGGLFSDSADLYGYEKVVVDEARRIAEYILKKDGDYKRIWDSFSGEDGTVSVFVKNLVNDGYEGWDKSHSGNSGAKAVHFANCLLDRSDLFPFLHGAMAELVGDEGYYDDRSDLPNKI
ncbi:MAG: hypothetical protein ACI4TK_05925 [Agathobacter sp.]